MSAPFRQFPRQDIFLQTVDGELLAPAGIYCLAAGNWLRWLIMRLPRSARRRRWLNHV